MLARPAGSLATCGVNCSFPEGARLPASPGGDLHFLLPADYDDPVRAVSVTALAALRPDEMNQPQRVRIIACIMFCDADGVAWQLEYPFPLYELWDRAAVQPMYARSTATPGAVAKEFERAERTLISKLSGYFDGRDRRTLVLIDPQERKDGVAAYIYVVPEKYFGFSMDLVEVRWRRKAPAVSAWFSSLSLQIELQTSYSLVAKTNARFDPIPLSPGEKRDLHENNPVLANHIDLPGPWSASPLAVAHRADVSAWKEALAQAGGASDERALAANPSVHFRPPGVWPSTR